MKMKFTYTEIKEAYLEVKQFLERESSQNIEHLNVRIMDDLGLWGYDNVLLLVKFVETYQLNFDAFEYEKHFDSEGEVFGFKALVVGLAKFPIFLINTLVLKHISPKFYANLGQRLYDKEKHKKDLTFGDLVLCKLAGEFHLRTNTTIELLTNSKKS